MKTKRSAKHPSADAPQGQLRENRESTSVSETPSTWSAIDENTLRGIDAEALKQCRGDVALWFHYRALLQGEFRIHCRGPEHWKKSWVLARNLPQYKTTEVSVIEGWRKLIENALKIRREQRGADSAINRAIILDGCGRAKDDQQASKVLQKRPNAIGSFAASGDVNFFRSLGRKLSADPPSDPKYAHAHDMLSYWLTAFLWLMPERTASDCLAGWCGNTPKTAKEGDTELRSFKETKRVYGLRSHKPTLIYAIDSDGNCILTPKGSSIFRSLLSSK